MPMPQQELQEITNAELYRNQMQIRNDIKDADSRIQKLEARVNYLFGAMGVLVIVINILDLVTHHTP